MPCDVSDYGGVTVWMDSSGLGDCCLPWRWRSLECSALSLRVAERGWYRGLRGLRGMLGWLGSLGLGLFWRLCALCPGGRGGLRRIFWVFACCCRCCFFICRDWLLMFMT